MLIVWTFSSNQAVLYLGEKNWSLTTSWNNFVRRFETRTISESPEQGWVGGWHFLYAKIYASMALVSITLIKTLQIQKRAVCWKVFEPTEEVLRESICESLFSISTLSGLFKGSLIAFGILCTEAEINTWII